MLAAAARRLLSASAPHAVPQFGKALRPAVWDGRLLWAGTEVAER